jgi:hypothetical protein
MTSPSYCGDVTGPHQGRTQAAPEAPLTEGQS